ncbi:MAG: hypothetical protein CL905_00875 [Dehalococcoidia bacterium]|nr:hypothetical protein [Dehalococcoidia bacterium]|tara:strand:+ start:487 stop:972 length:486 start_codon:yes stop_codon:yes gene_type:complete
MDIKIIDQYRITNNQVLNYIDDVTDEESKLIFEPLNCISWTLGHLARYNNLTFAARSRGVEIPNEFKDFENGAPHSQKDLSYVKGLWHKTLSDTEKFLDGLNENDLVKVLDNDSYNVDNLGTVMTRMIFHSWNHLGEIASVRQLIGKNPGNPGYGKWDWKY